jgi:outer membrane protein
LKTNLILFVALLSAIATFSQKKWTLKECVDQALEKNISIQQNKLSVALAKKDVAIAKGNFLPNLGGNLGNSMNFGLTTGADNTNTTAERYVLSLGLNGSGTIFNGFRNTNTYKQAQLGVESSLLDLEKIENDISLFVVNGYLNILFAKENLEVAKVQAEISKKQIEAAKERFEAGAIAKGELLNFQSTAANDLQNVITQENALDLAVLNLAQLLQVSVDNFDVSPIDVGTPSSNLLYKNSSSVYDKSLTRMPEIARAKLAIENSDFNIEIAKGAFLPTLSYSFGASSFYNTVLGESDFISGVINGVPFEIDNRFSQQLFKNNFNYQVGLNLNIPIFNRFQTKNRVAQSLINKEISETRLESEKLTLKQTIEQAFLDVRSALKAYEAATISLDAQNEAFKNAQERYNYGAMTLFDFDLVRTRLVNAQGTMIRSKYDYVFKTKVLQFYSGDLVLE